MKTVYVIGTCDTKRRELDFVKSLILAAGLPAVLVDVGTGAAGTAAGANAAGTAAARADVAAAEVAAHHPQGAGAVLGLDDRGAAIGAMGQALVAFLATRADIGGVIGLGGSGNTGLVTRGMRSLPVGLPKIMVSTVASGDVGPYVGSCDLCMMYSITDIAGINRINSAVLGNAANAIAGMVGGSRPDHREKKRSIGLTQFGVTTPCVDRVRAALDGEEDCLVFHATGTGGRSMEKLADDGFLAGIIDVTTTEVADFLVGGILPCTEDRFGAVARTGIPYVVSCGALDMVNFGAIDTVPPRYRDRRFYEHNPQVNLMRTTAAENAAFGRWIAARLNRCDGPVRLLIPEKGISAIDAPGRPFHDPEADAALFDALQAELVQTGRRRLVRLPHHINDPAFADALVAHFRAIAG